QAMTTQVNRCIENLRRVEAIKGCVLDQDDTLADLIGARSYKPHPEAGYTTDNLLLSLTVECLAMREETIYVPPRNPRDTLSITSNFPGTFLGTSSTSSMTRTSRCSSLRVAVTPP